MYQKYQTEAIVLRSYERGEADRVFALYTKEFGYIWARASAVRRESSRMRYALQPYGIATIGLVRGLRGWRAVGASVVAHIEPSKTEGSAAFARIAKLLERLAGGEEKNEYAFAALCEAHEALRRAEIAHFSAIELLTVARILYSFGYLSADALGSALFTHTALTHEAITEAESARTTVLSAVNKALSETHL